MKHLMSGNEATARGVYEAGIKVCSAYPGTPSTEILENLPQYGKDVYCEWAPNEKVATEVAYGASVAGSRSFCTMKMVGLNVAADRLFTAGYFCLYSALPELIRRSLLRHGNIIRAEFLRRFKHGAGISARAKHGRPEFIRISPDNVKGLPAYGACAAQNSYILHYLLHSFSPAC